MTKISAPLYKGKLKLEIADEAFNKLGKQATIQEVDVYFRKRYKLPGCERSMYLAARRRANGQPTPPRRSYKRVDEEKQRKNNIIALVARTKALAYDLGGWDIFEELIRELKKG